MATYGVISAALAWVRVLKGFVVPAILWDRRETASGSRDKLPKFFGAGHISW